MVAFASSASIGLTKRIRAGSFRMGSRFHPREHPSKVVYVAEFEIAHVPVTVSQYAAFINSKEVRDRRWWSEPGWAWLNGELDGWGRENRLQPDGWLVQQKKAYHPVTGVSVYEAEAYCTWLSIQKNKKIRLPTEEEWEYAARGDDGRPFPWGEEFDPQFANTLEQELMDTVNAGSVTGDTSPFGLMDMCGNVQQWTSTLYAPLPGETYPPGELRIARGGSFNDTVYGSRTSYRRAYPAGYFYPFLGFRIVVAAT